MYVSFSLLTILFSKYLKLLFIGVCDLHLSAICDTFFIVCIVRICSVLILILALHILGQKYIYSTSNWWQFKPIELQFHKTYSNLHEELNQLITTSWVIARLEGSIPTFLTSTLFEYSSRKLQVVYK